MIFEHKEKISLKMSITIRILTFISKVTNKKLWSFVIDKKQKFIKPLKRYNTEVFKINDINLFKISKNNETDKFIVYFHGGGFVMSGNRRHHNFIIKLHKKTGFDCYYIGYPLAPLNKSLDVINNCEMLIKKLMLKEPNKKMILMGDSAGANLALVLSKRFPENEAVILLSPWLDLTMSNKEILSMEKKEVMFSRQDLLNAAKDYQGTLELNDPLISQIYDKFPDMNIKIFAGKDDLLFPDVLKFVNANDNMDLHIYYGLNHDFMFLVSGKEQNEVIERIVEYIL
jgi:acetyl esterase/lipase